MGEVLGWRNLSWFWVLLVSGRGGAKWNWSFYSFQYGFSLDFCGPLGCWYLQLNPRALTKVFLSVDDGQVCVSVGEIRAGTSYPAILLISLPFSIYCSSSLLYNTHSTHSLQGWRNLGLLPSPPSGGAPGDSCSFCLEDLFPRLICWLSTLGFTLNPSSWETGFPSLPYLNISLSPPRILCLITTFSLRCTCHSLK